MPKPLSKLVPKTLRPLAVHLLTKAGFLQGDTFSRERLDAFIAANRGRALPERETVFSQEVLIPCHNHGRFLPAVLDVLQGLPIAVTIINDASTDDTAEIIARLQMRHPFKLITNETNLLQFGSLNRAIEESDNNLFTVLNADDFLLPRWLEYVRSVFAETRLALLGGGRIPFQGEASGDAALSRVIRSIAYVPAEDPTVRGPRDVVHFTNDNSIDMTMSGCSFLKSAWSFVGGFFPREKRVSLWDDRDFQMRVCAFFDIGITTELSAFYRTNSSLGLGTA